MKKQEISKIPYMKAKKADKKYPYIAVQMTHEIKGESHLFMEIFDNTREGRKKPKLRMIFTKNDWCLYYVREGTWSQASFRDEYGNNIWEKGCKPGEGKTYITEEDQEIVQNWCGDHPIKNRYTTWSDRLKHLIDDIRYKRMEKTRKQRGEKP